MFLLLNVTYFTSFSSVSIAHFEQVNVSWEIMQFISMVKLVVSYSNDYENALIVIIKSLDDNWSSLAKLHF